jgi:MFS family permease
VRGFRTQIFLLFVLQALASTVSVALVAVNGICGLEFASDKRLATLPITAFVVGGAAITFGASQLMARKGRAVGFRAGSALAILGSVLGILSTQGESFWLLCAAGLLMGGYAATAAYTRFAAAEAAPEDHRARAIAWVMSAGIVGAVLGPESTKWTRDLTEQHFVATYASLGVLALLSFITALWLDLPLPAQAPAKPSFSGVARAAAAAPTRAALTTSAVGYAVMIFLMTGTPLAMSHHHHHYDDTALVIQWHVLGMYAPSFITATLIRRLSPALVIMGGTALMLLCIGLNFAGTTLPHFWFALVALGIGWNFMYIGGTTLLAESSQPEQKHTLQGVNEVLVLGSNAIASALSGVMLHELGWQSTNLVSIPFVVLAAVACLPLLKSRPARASSA